MKTSQTLLDTHLHCIEPDRFRYPWIAEVAALAGRTFSVDDYRALAGANVSAALFMEGAVEPMQMASEARQYLALAEDPDSPLAGVIAACLPEDKAFGNYLGDLQHPYLKGFRRVLHTEPDALSQDARFRQNVALLAKLGYPFDLCVLTRQLPIARDLVDACPDTTFILDHCGASGIAPGPEAFQAWKALIGTLAERDNIVCKISGIIAYVEAPVTTESLRPFVETCAESFGPRRILWGSDFPVCNLGADLPTWIQITQALFEGEPPENQALFFQENARRVYKLWPAR